MPNIILGNTAGASAASLARHTFDPLRPRNFIAKAPGLDLKLSPDFIKLEHIITMMLASGALTNPDDRYALDDTATIVCRFRAVLDPTMIPRTLSGGSI